MNSENKKKYGSDKILVIILIIVIVIAILAIVGKKIVANNSKNEVLSENSGNVETSNNKSDPEKLADLKKYDGMEISNSKIEVKDKISRFTATAKNTTNENKKEKVAVIVYYDKNGNEIARSAFTLLATNAGEETIIDISTNANLENVFNYKIEDMPENKK